MSYIDKFTQKQDYRYKNMLVTKPRLLFFLEILGFEVEKNPVYAFLPVLKRSLF